MKNAMIPEKEIEIIKEIADKVKELKEVHMSHSLTPMMVGEASELEQVHIIFYMDLLKTFLTSISALKDFLDVSEEEFLKVVTEDGKLSLDEVKKELMKQMLLEMIMD